MPTQRTTGHGVRISLLTFALIGGAALLWCGGLFDLEHVRALAGEAGPAAPVLFTLTYAGVTLFPVPKNVLSALAGAVFGLMVGVALVWAAAMVGAVVSFAIARRVDPTALAWATGRHHDKVHAVLARHGMTAVTSGRLIPVAPFTAVNYIAGMSGVRTRDYVLGTGLGIIPGTVVYVAVGAFGVRRPDLLGWAAVALLSVLAGGAFLARRFTERELDGA